MVKQDPKIHGDFPEIPVGLMFADRADVYNSGLHGHPLAGIFGTKGDGGAFSVVLNEGYEDDEDMGEVIIYTGEGKGKPEDGKEPRAGKNRQQGDQDMKSNGNAALKQVESHLAWQKNVETGYPVRVIRGPDGNVKYSPLQGYRYDGLYNVERAYIEEGKAGFKMCRFQLRRADVPEQAPLTLVTGEGPSDQYWSPDNRRETLAVRKLNNPAPPETARARTMEQKRQEIAGKRRLPTNLSFRKTA